MALLHGQYEIGRIDHFGPQLARDMIVERQPVSLEHVGRDGMHAITRARSEAGRRYEHLVGDVAAQGGNGHWTAADVADTDNQHAFHVTSVAGAS